jgi:hypothetical protein
MSYARSKDRYGAHASREQKITHRTLPVTLSRATAHHAVDTRFDPYEERYTVPDFVVDILVPKSLFPPLVCRN